MSNDYYAAENDEWRARFARPNRKANGSAEACSTDDDARLDNDPPPLIGAFTFLGEAPAAPPRELIKKLLPANGVVIQGGQSSAGKTFLEIHKSVCLATQ